MFPISLFGSLHIQGTEADKSPFIKGCHNYPIPKGPGKVSNTDLRVKQGAKEFPWHVEEPISLRSCF